jgi:toxin FitB
VGALLDTNVLSELLKRQPDQRVVEWLASMPADDLFVSAVTEAEMMLGARLLPAGKRRAALEEALGGMFDHDFAGRILPFDRPAVTAYVEIVGQRRKIGRPISQFDAQIAATALCRELSLATRNTADFEACGLHVIDPWERGTQ